MEALRVYLTALQSSYMCIGVSSVQLRWTARTCHTVVILKVAPKGVDCHIRKPATDVLAGSRGTTCVDRLQYVYTYARTFHEPIVLENKGGVSGVPGMNKRRVPGYYLRQNRCPLPAQCALLETHRERGHGLRARLKIGAVTGNMGRSLHSQH